MDLKIDMVPKKGYRDHNSISNIVGLKTRKTFQCLKFNIKIKCQVCSMKWHAAVNSDMFVTSILLNDMVSKNPSMNKQDTKNQNMK